MFTRQNVVQGFLWPALFFLAIAFTYQSCLDEGDNPPDTGFELTFLPDGTQQLFGYTDLQLLFNPDYEVEILNITYQDGSRTGSLLDEDTPIRQERGRLEFPFCAECMESEAVTLTVVATDGVKTITLTETFTVNHLPVVDIFNLASGLEYVVLSAEESYDPEGLALDFTWFVGEEVYEGPIVELDRFTAANEPIMLSVTDGVTVVFDVVTIDLETGDPVYTPDHLKCESMEIAVEGKGLLNPEIDLGPVPAVETVLPIDADKKLTRSYRIGFSFEVRAEIKIDENIVLDEGQDAAGTGTVGGRDTHKRGRTRKEPNRSEYEGAAKDAPFPDPLPEAGSHPEMVEDGYDHHPNWGYGDRNGANGAERFRLKSKGLVPANKMVWFDQPGIVLPKGTSVADGITFKAYFRAWMKPDIPPCQKFFYVEIIVDSDGKVTQNRLVMR